MLVCILMLKGGHLCLILLNKQKEIKNLHLNLYQLLILITHKINYYKLRIRKIFKVIVLITNPLI